ncbi:MAG: nitrous oxide reductase family maturation protein NosD [Bacteroidetes bacterium]|nr:nitrous oxide reductase family maturation protein NosD [Bacteroidota bacterium]
MNRIVSAICLLPLLLFAIGASGARIEVDGKKFSIKSAIHAAKSGDTLIVLPGHYKEGNIIINKRLTLLGKDYPTLDGAHKYEVITINADSVVVSGFRVIRSGQSSLKEVAAIKLNQVYRVQILNNILDDNNFGIFSLNCGSCTISGNKIKAYGKGEQTSGNGIHCWKSVDMRILGNMISGHRDGIYFEFVTSSIIWRNISEHNIRYGLHFMFSHDDAYISNVFSQNGAGVAVMFTHGIKMFNNYFLDNWGEAAYGLLLKEISNSLVSGNHFQGNTTGIHMEGGTRILMQRNVFERNGYALRIQGSCDQDTLLNNDFIGNTFDVATNSSQSLNYFNHNYWDKYEGYDLRHDGLGDVPFRPVSLFSTVVESMPTAMVLFRSFMVVLLDKAEKILPSVIPEGLRDDAPSMKENIKPLS